MVVTFFYAWRELPAKSREKMVPKSNLVFGVSEVRVKHENPSSNNSLLNIASPTCAPNALAMG